MFIYGVTIATLMQASCSRLFATLLKIRYITEKKSYLDKIGHISYYLHISLKQPN